MARKLTDAQKQQIRVSLPDTITIGSNTYASSKLWSNQELKSYPSIIMDVYNDGIDADIEDIETGPLYYSCILTIHVYARTDTSKDCGAVIAETLAQAIMDTVATWTTPLSTNIRIFDPMTDIKGVGFVGHNAGVFDYVISITLFHS